jgi:hypothetical protein
MCEGLGSNADFATSDNLGKFLSVGFVCVIGLRCFVVAQILMKFKIAVFAFASLSILFLFTEGRLEKDARALANVIAERKLCGLTPTYRGFDAVAGMYDFDRTDQREFSHIYESTLTIRQLELSKLKSGEIADICRTIVMPVEGDPRSIID